MMSFLQVTALFAAGFQITLNFISAYYAFRTARIKVTPTMPWVLFGFTFIAAALRKASLFMISSDSIVRDPRIVMWEVVFNSIVSILATIAIVMIYNLIKGKFKGMK